MARLREAGGYAEMVISSHRVDRHCGRNDGNKEIEAMRQRFERVTRKHHSRALQEAEVETATSPSTDEHLQQEIERILEEIDEVLEGNADFRA